MKLNAHSKKKQFVYHIKFYIIQKVKLEAREEFVEKHLHSQTTAQEINGSSQKLLITDTLRKY